jgi:3',5'-cyclic AMP phosphodiesterase CpdA
VTGDLTHVGLPMEFRQALAWLRELGAPEEVLVIPGNHDASVATPWEDTFSLWRDYMASDELAAGDNELFPSLRVRGQIAFIGLSTACPKPPLMATGTVSARQLEQLPRLLDAARQQGLFRVVHLHHSPLPGKEIWRKRLTNARQVLQLIIDHGAELVLNGHGHRAHYDELTTSQGMAPVIAIPSASAMGLHGSNAAAYNCYQVERDGEGWQLQVQSRRYQPDREAFAAAEKKSVYLARRP